MSSRAARNRAFVLTRRALRRHCAGAGFAVAERVGVRRGFIVDLTPLGRVAPRCAPLPFCQEVASPSRVVGCEETRSPLARPDSGSVLPPPAWPLQRVRYPRVRLQPEIGVQDGLLNIWGARHTGCCAPDCRRRRRGFDRRGPRFTPTERSDPVPCVNRIRAHGQGPTGTRHLHPL